MIKEMIELSGGVEISRDVENRVKTVGVRGLDLNKAKELGVFTRIANILSAMHATITAANIIYGHASLLMNELHGRKNEIAREMNMFEKSYERFLNFWTGYYANGDSAKEVNRDTELLYHRIMEWSQIPEVWNLGDEQRTQYNKSDVAIRIHLEELDRIYTFFRAALNHETTDQKETWGVLCYDTETDKQTTVHTDLDKASALMVAKRLSAENENCIYTAAMVLDITEKRTEVVPFKAFMKNETVGNIMKVEK